jgi:hypothetical protein
MLKRVRVRTKEGWDKRKRNRQRLDSPNLSSPRIKPVGEGGSGSGSGSGEWTYSESRSSRSGTSSMDERSDLEPPNRHSASKSTSPGLRSQGVLTESLPIDGPPDDMHNLHIPFQPFSRAPISTIAMPSFRREPMPEATASGARSSRYSGRYYNVGGNKMASPTPVEASSSSSSRPYGYIQEDQPSTSLGMSSGIHHGPYQSMTPDAGQARRMRGRSLITASSQHLLPTSQQAMKELIPAHRTVVESYLNRYLNYLFMHRKFSIHLFKFNFPLFSLLSFRNTAHPQYFGLSTIMAPILILGIFDWRKAKPHYFGPCPFTFS